MAAAACRWTEVQSKSCTLLGSLKVLKPHRQPDLNYRAGLESRHHFGALGTALGCCASWRSFTRRRSVRSARSTEEELELATLRSWLQSDASLVMAVTNKGLETCVARELEFLHNIDSAIFDNRLYFPWRGGRCPVVCGT
eukprot:symbB.v1.2.017829.t1/scaffold1324.1/size125322/11